MEKTLVKRGAGAGRDSCLIRHLSHLIPLTHTNSATIRLSRQVRTEYIHIMLDLRSWNSKDKRRSFHSSQIRLHFKEKQL